MMSRAAVVAAGLGAWVLGCAFQRKSEDFACGGPSECMSGRTCVNGFCVEGGGGTPDAPLFDADPNAPDAPPLPDAGPADAFVCPPGCSTCQGDVCVITCNNTTTAPCNGVISCPAGVKCKVECLGTGTCALGVDCSLNLACRVECAGGSSCAGPIACGSGECVVECTNSNTCTGGIDCTDSCQCMLLCTGSGSCVPPATCPAECPPMGSGCKVTGPDCTCI